MNKQRTNIGIHVHCVASIVQSRSAVMRYSKISKHTGIYLRFLFGCPSTMIIMLVS